MPSKKDFVAVAAVIKSIGHRQFHKPDFADGVDAAREYIARDLANLYAQQNPRFDRARFLAACGVNVNR